MPAYDYICQDCGERFAIRVSMATYSQGVTPSCPACQSENAARSFASVNVLTGSRSSGGGDAGCGPSGFS